MNITTDSSLLLMYVSMTPNFFNFRSNFASLLMAINGDNMEFITELVFYTLFRGRHVKSKKMLHVVYLINLTTVSY